MTWLTLRQFRSQLLTALVLLAVAVAYLLWAGYTIRTAYNTDILGCVAADGCDISNAVDRFVRAHQTMVVAPSVVLIAVPAVIGVFWGAPLIARELETHTHRLAWNQSITRTRWLAVKLAVVGLISLAVTGLLGLLLTWAASRYDQLQGTRFETLSFASRNIAPLGYVAFTFVLGTMVGLLLKRSVPAMAVTLLVVGLLQIAVPTVGRAYLDPVTESVSYNAAARQNGGMLALSNDDPAMVMGYTVPGALMLTDIAELVNTAGATVYAADVRDCVAVGAQNKTDPTECLAALGLSFEVRYQPADRYWPFQWLEFGVFSALALLLAGLTFWRIRHLTA